jgi:hypothetical protein
MYDIKKTENTLMNHENKDHPTTVIKPIIFLEDELKEVKSPTITSFNYLALSDANLALTNLLVNMDADDGDYFKKFMYNLNDDQSFIIREILYNSIREIASINFAGLINSECEKNGLNFYIKNIILDKFNNTINTSSNDLFSFIYGFIKNYLICHRDGKEFDKNTLLNTFQHKDCKIEFCNIYDAIVTSYSYNITNYISALMTYCIHSGLYDYFILNKDGYRNPQVIREEIIKNISQRKDILTEYLKEHPSSIYNLALLYFENSFTIQLYNIMTDNIEPSIRHSLEITVGTFFYMFDDLKNKYNVENFIEKQTE